MRRTILILSAAETALLVFAALRLVFGRIRSDAAGQGMAQAFSIIASVVAVVLIVPAVTLAFNERWLGFALTLVLIAAFFVVVALISTF